MQSAHFSDWNTVNIQQRVEREKEASRLVEKEGERV